ncbi:hypothetical protein SLEP1_g46698 [Rubroshorea leprosula]|uniref:Uncharacterized protein n=1 Tax=Rubroshorea leprosula TaxID=152421 RepID=A0AAV5LNT4_9ROSI|nr:hypothetical protein SLEP1_g46698 [Rubroshorea leprosula]
MPFRKTCSSLREIPTLRHVSLSIPPVRFLFLYASEV